MFVFGHVGIALAAAALLDRSLRCKRHPGRQTDSPAENSSSSSTLQNNPPDPPRASVFASLARHMDMRVLLVASLLPDIIDKPVGRIIFRETFENGRIFAHTVLFLLLATLIGFLVPSKNRFRIGMALALGISVHLILDAMWRMPETLFWPLYGLSFGKYPSDLYSWAGLQEAVQRVMEQPFLALPELVGAAVVFWFVYELFRKRRLYDFFRHGTV